MVRDHKTKIVATIGPASDSPVMMEALIRAGVDVARLNFSHGDFAYHSKLISSLRQAAATVGRTVAIMADLPGPKMRIGRLAPESVELHPGDNFRLTTEQVIGGQSLASVDFAGLPDVVKTGDQLYLNDGIVQLEVVGKSGRNVDCRVFSGGPLSSRKGLNLPGIDLGISAFTDRDRECLDFALEQGIDAVSQSFVESAADIEAVRGTASRKGYEPFVIAKIERSRALDQIDGILEAADGIMIARGDLGVETPVEQMAILQKRLIGMAFRRGRTVITATQMLESMTRSRQPTRAEATDVANSILDGTDCVMLSAESAVGRFPVEAVSTLSRIAAATEPHRSRLDLWETLKTFRQKTVLKVPDLVALSVEAVLEYRNAAAVVVPTRSGKTARSISRFRLPVWIVAPTPSPAVCQHLVFSYGVYPMTVSGDISDWAGFARTQLAALELEGDLALLVQGPSARHPEANHGIEFIER